MKVKKSDIQKNVVLNTYYYTDLQIEDMFTKGIIWYIKDINDRENEYDITGNSYAIWSWHKEVPLRIDLDKGDELNVVNKDGSYTTALLKNGKSYYVTL